MSMQYQPGPYDLGISDDPALEGGPAAEQWLSIGASDLHPEGGAWMDLADARQAAAGPDAQIEIEAS